MADELDPDTGLSLADAVLAFGDLPDPVGHRQRRSVLALCEISGRELVLDDTAAAKQAWVNYSIDENAARIRVLEKLIAGELRATALVRGAPPDQGAVEIHRERWRVLTPDWAASSASTAATLIESILVFRAPPPAILVQSEPPAYGEKTKRAKAWIVDNRAKLAGLSRNEQARLVATETRCSESLAKGALKDELGPAGR